MTAPMQMKWFRVEQSADGSILSCTEVDAKGCKGAHVRFYEALDKATACTAAKRWYTDKREKERVARIFRSAERASRGECRECGTAKVDGGCPACAEIQRQKRAGTWVPKQTPRPRLTDAERADFQTRKAAQARDAAKRAGGSLLVSTALKKLDELSPGEARAFREWLVVRMAQFQAIATAPDPAPGEMRLPPKKYKKIDWFESRLERKRPDGDDAAQAAE